MSIGSLIRARRSAWLFLALLILPAVVAAQSASDADREIARLRGLADREKQLAAEEASRHAEWQKMSSARIEEMRRELVRVRGESDSLRRVRDQASRQAAAPKPAPKARPDDRRRVFANELARQIDALLPRLERELDRGEGRRQAWTALSRDLRSGAIEPGEGLGRFLDQLAELVDQGGRIEAQAGSYTSRGGRMHRGHFVRAGGILEAFVDDEGGFAALRRRGDSTAFDETLGSDQAAGLSRAVAVLKGEQPPAWILLPLAGEAAR